MKIKFKPCTLNKWPTDDKRKEFIEKHIDTVFDVVEEDFNNGLFSFILHDIKFAKGRFIVIKE